MQKKKKEEWYLSLTSQPKIVGNLVFVFQPPYDDTNTGHLEINSNTGQLLMMSDYLISDDASTIRITYKHRNIVLRPTNTDKPIHVELISHYMILSVYDFEQLLNDQQFELISNQ